MVSFLVVTIYVLVCLLLLVVVLLQQGKGGDIAAAFGGSSSQTAFGVRAGATVLTRATAILGTLFMLFALGQSIMSREGGGGSVVGNVDAPKPASTTPAAPALPTAPVTPPPGGSSSGAPAAAPGTTPPATPPSGTGRESKPDAKPADAKPDQSKTPPKRGGGGQ
jgi:preprotein translocase subunit SecG